MRSPFRTSSGSWAWLLALVLLFAAGPGRAQTAKGGAAPFRKDTFTNSAGMTFVKLTPGRFRMGDGEADEEDQRPAHEVRIGRSFALQTTEVTQGQWKAVMGTEPWKVDGGIPRGDDHPAVYAGWEAARAFCRRLSEKHGRVYRLPSEAEWEYACRAGTADRYGFGGDAGALGEFAWFSPNTFGAGERHPHPVGRKRPKAWGLFDMHGNVMEWCEDDWHDSYAGAPPDGRAWVDRPRAAGRVLRGGCWHLSAPFLTSAHRDAFRPGLRFEAFAGFRVVLAE